MRGLGRQSSWNRTGRQRVGSGVGSGVIIQRLSKLASAGHIAGIDPSQEMVEQARTRNTDAIERGRVDLRRGSVETLPFDDATFDKALTVKSMQVWPDPSADCGKCGES